MAFELKQIDWSSGVQSPAKHIVGHIGDGFLRVKWPNQQCQRTEGMTSLYYQVQVFIFLDSWRSTLRQWNAGDKAENVTESTVRDDDRQRRQLSNDTHPDNINKHCQLPVCLYITRYTPQASLAAC